MATLREESIFTTPVYLIERTDPLMGGEYGISNMQARQLANRTRYLLDTMLREHSLNGSHHLTEANVAELANIAESKLSLTHSTQQLYDNVTDAQTVLARVVNALDAVQDLEDSQFRTIYQALLLSWRIGFPRFAFEMFTGNFTFRDSFPNVRLVETISGDDSIDVVNSENIVPGESYIIWDAETNESTPVTVKKILTTQRVILYEDSIVTRSRTGVLTKMSWQLQDGAAICRPGSMYISKKIDLLQDFDRGNLVIAHYAPADFTVEYRKTETTDPTAWQPMALIRQAYSDTINLYRSVYETPGGEFYLRITANTDCTVAHMAFMSDVISALNTTVRTPEVVDNDFTIMRFGAVYNAQHMGTVFELSKTPDFTGGYTTLTFGPKNSVLPHWDYKADVLANYHMEEGDEVYWRAWYTASDGYRSRWSDIGHFVK